MSGMQAQGLSQSGKDVPLAVDEDGKLLISGLSGGGSGFSLVQSEDLGAGTKYTLKASGTTWQMIRKTYTDTSSLMAYASVKNNPSTTLATAWGSRTTLTYGSIGDI